MRRPAARLLLAAAVVAAMAASAWAADTVDRSPTWASLTPAQKQALAPLQRDWPTIDAPRKQKWLEMAQRFPAMPEAERRRVQDRMTEWARMTPAERGEARQRFQELRQLSPEERQARWEAYRALPDDERKEFERRAMPAPKAVAVTPTSRSASASAPVAKRNIVPVERQAVGKPVAPTVLQARPGATTTLITTKPAPPAHQQPGLPKIAATEGFVNPATLLPRRGPQGAAVETAASAPLSQP